MSRNFSVTEPHPSVAKGGAYYLAGGRGGAGNYKRYSSEQLSSGPTATGPASLMSLNKNYPRHVAIGRGGAGNLYTAPQTEQPMFQFDEEMLSQREGHAPVYHIGRGGAANFVDESKSRTQRNHSTGSNGSIASNESVRRSLEGVVSKIQNKLSRH